MAENTPQVLARVVSDYVRRSLEYKQELQQNRSKGSKYQSKIPFVRLQSNAIKWLDYNDKVELYNDFLKIEKEIVKNIEKTFVDGGSELRSVSINFRNYNSILNNSFVLLDSSKMKLDQTSAKKGETPAIFKLEDGVKFDDVIDISDSAWGKNDIELLKLSEDLMSNIESMEFKVKKDGANFSIVPSTSLFGSSSTSTVEQVIKNALDKSYSRDFGTSDTGNLGFLFDIKKKIYDSNTNNIKIYEHEKKKYNLFNVYVKNNITISRSHEISFSKDKGTKKKKNYNILLTTNPLTVSNPNIVNTVKIDLSGIKISDKGVIKDIQMKLNPSISLLSNEATKYFTGVFDDPTKAIIINKILNIGSIIIGKEYNTDVITPDNIYKLKTHILDVFNSESIELTGNLTIPDGYGNFNSSIEFSDFTIAASILVFLKRFYKTEYEDLIKKIKIKVESPLPPPKILTLAIPTNVIEELVKLPSFFSVQRINYDRVKLLLTLYDIIFNNMVVSYSELYDNYNINVTRALEGVNTSEIAISKFFGKNTEYARNHILHGIDLSGNTGKYDGGFFIFEKDGKFTADTEINRFKSKYTSLTDKEFKELETNFINTTYQAGLGYRPKAGIVSVSVDTQGNIGTLRRVTINLKAFTLEQLEMIHSLYMRPGIFLFLEWGWSIYPNLKTPDGEIKTNMSNVLFLDGGYTNKHIKDLNTEIDDYKTNTFGHYDALFGIINNFSWNMNDSGEFDITVNLVSSTTSLLALQMSANNKAYRESSFSVDVFDKFRNYFNVLSKNNVNFKILENESKLGDFKDTNSFKKFNIKSKVDAAKLAVVSGKDANNLDSLVVYLNRNPDVCVDLPFRLKFELDKNLEWNDPDIVNPTRGKGIIINENTYKRKINIYGYDKDGYGGTDSQWQSGRIIGNEARLDKMMPPNLGDPDFLPPHIIRFPLINNDKFKKQGYSDNVIEEYMTSQGFGNMLSEIFLGVDKIIEIDGWRHLCTTAIKINNVKLSMTIIEQIRDRYKGNNVNKNKILTTDGLPIREDENRIKVNLVRGIGGKEINLHDIYDLMYANLKKVYVEAYKYFFENLNEFPDAREFKSSDDFQKYMIGYFSSKYRITQAMYMQPYGYYRKDHMGYNEEPKGHLINKHAYNKLFSLRHIQDNMISTVKWDDKTGDKTKKYDPVIQTKHTLYYSESGAFNDTSTAGSIVDIPDENVAATTQESAEQSLNKKIQSLGGFEPFFISLRFLFYLLNQSLINKGSLNDGVHVGIGMDYTKFMSEMPNNLKDIIKEIETKYNNDSNKHSDPKKAKEELNKLVYDRIQEYNSNIKNLKNSLFNGINIDDPVPTRKIDDLTSIKQINVIFITKEISKINSLDSTLSIDNTSDDYKGGRFNDILKSCYISCPFIAEQLKSSQSLDSFIKSILGEVNEASGGFIDLIMSEDENKTENDNKGYKLNIYDRKYDKLKVVDKSKVANTSTNTNAAANTNMSNNTNNVKDFTVDDAFKFSALSNKSIINQLSFGAKLPTSFQRVAFVAASPVPGSVSNSNIVNNTLNNFSNGFVNNPSKIKFIDKYDEYHDIDMDHIREKNIETYSKLKEKPLNYSLILENDNFSSYYSNVIEDKYIKFNGKKENTNTSFRHTIPTRFMIPPIGLELSFKIDGTSGLEWGNLISIDYLPESLKNSVFQITKLTEEINDSSWTTNISCVLRFIDRKDGK